MIIRKREVVRKATDCLMLDWNDEAEAPEISFYFGDTLRTYVVPSVEDLGKLISVFIGCEERVVTCDGGLVLRHVIDMNLGYVFTLNPGSGDGCEPEKRVGKDFYVSPFEAVVLVRALESFCLDSMRNHLECPCDGEED